MSACGNVPCLECSTAGCGVSIIVFLGHILVSASAGRGELNAADWSFVLLVAYLLLVQLTKIIPTGLESYDTIKKCYKLKETLR